MYMEDAIPDLLKTLIYAADHGSEIFIAHGRNRQAEATFVRLCNERFRMTHLTDSDMDEVYQTVDVDVLQLSRI